MTCDHVPTVEVAHNDSATTWYPAPRGWRVDSMVRCIVVKSPEPGEPATWIPLDGVRYWTVTRNCTC